MAVHQLSFGNQFGYKCFICNGPSTKFACHQYENWM